MATIHLPILLTIAQLFDVLHNVNTATFATLHTITDARLNKTYKRPSFIGVGTTVEDNPYGQVWKRSRVNVTLNPSDTGYGDSVNRQREREGNAADFQPQARKWGTHIPGTPLLTHEGKRYLSCKVEKSFEHEYFNEEGVLSDEAVAPFKRSKKSSAESQGVEREVVARPYGLENVRKIALGGAVYVIAYGT